MTKENKASETLRVTCPGPYTILVQSGTIRVPRDYMRVLITSSHSLVLLSWLLF